jgi:hypothetical protein
MGMVFLRVVVGDDPYEAAEREKPTAKKTQGVLRPAVWIAASLRSSQ